MPPPPNFQQGNPYQQAPGGYQQFAGGYGGQIDHPRAGNVHTLGVLGLVFTFVFGIVGLILNIVCLSIAGGVLNEVNSNPGKYTEASVRKIRSGRTCAIVGLSIQGAAVLIVLLLIAANA